MKTRSLLRDQAGSTLVEFALSGGLIFSIILSIMDGSRAFYADHFVANIAREASRYAMVRGSTWSGTSCTSMSTANCMATAANVTSFVQGNMPAGLSSSNVMVTTTWPGVNPNGVSCQWSAATNSPGCLVNVKVQYSFRFITPFLSSSAFLLNSTSKVVISQ